MLMLAAKIANPNMEKALFKTNVAMSYDNMDKNAKYMFNCGQLKVWCTKFEIKCLKVV